MAVQSPDFSAYVQRAKDLNPQGIFIMIPGGAQPGAFGKGPNVKLAYRVVDYSAGDASRWSFGSVTGKAKGSLTVEAVYLDKSGHELGKIRSEGKVGSSLLGKSMDDAVEHVADEVALYTTQTFK